MCFKNFAYRQVFNDAFNIEFIYYLFLSTRCYSKPLTETRIVNAYISHPSPFFLWLYLCKHVQLFYKPRLSEHLVSL